MVAGLKFLSKKGFNPQNLTNQKAVWEARQQKEHESKRLKEREDQLRRERDDEELARARGGDRLGDQATLKFMYAPPPGLAAPEHAAGNNKSESGISNLNSNSASNNNNNNNNDDNSITNNLTVQRQKGDDDAAAAFRQMLAAAAATNTSVRQGQDEATSSGEVISNRNVSSSGAALSGTTVEKTMPTDKELTALEKAVGRRDASSSGGLSLEEQIARFPQLKNAPMAKGMNATNVGVTFKPLGTQLRNVRCMVCGIWGHSRGDRECQKSGWDPFSSNPRPTPTAVAAAVATAAAGILPDSESWTQQDGCTPAKSIDAKEDTKRRARDDLSESSSDSEASYRRRERRRKHSKSHHKKSKRKRRDEDERRSSHKRRKKHSRQDESRANSS